MTSTTLVTSTTDTADAPTPRRRRFGAMAVAGGLFVGALTLGSASTSASSYPYPSAPDCDEGATNNGCVADMWSFYQGQCTSWVAWKLNSVNGVAFDNYYKGVRWSNASNWDNAARAVGIRVDGTPARGAVAQWNARNHVAYVEQVHSDGSITISEKNFDLHNGERTRQLARGAAGWPDNFIHIKDLATAPTSYVGKIVRNSSTGAAYLVKTNGKRYHIPTGGDYRAIVNNGVAVVNLSPTQISKIPEAAATATVKRVDEPSISGPSYWMTRRTGTSHGYAGDYWITTSAAGKSYTTNKAVWKITSRPSGVYRVKVFIPHREAVAQVKYKVYDGSKYLKTVSINQRYHYGWASLGSYRFTSGTIKIVQADNWGPGPYNSVIGWDAAEAVPIR